MTNKHSEHHRRSIRLKGYDYSQAGLYFITICVQNRECLFGKIVGASLVDAKNTDAQMILNDAGKMVQEEWIKLQERFTNIALHEYIVMPNHFHAILEIVGATLVVAQNEMAIQNEMATQNNVVAQNETAAPNGNGECNIQGQPQGIAPTGKTVGDMVGAFESITTVEYIRGVKNNNWQTFDKKLWQRNYWEHIIRNEQSYLKISEYIVNNPANWNNDTFKTI